MGVFHGGHGRTLILMWGWRGIFTEDTERHRVECADARVPYIIVRVMWGRGRGRWETFLYFGLKKLGKRFGAKKIMSTFAPVSEILLLTDTDEAHKSGSVGTAWANTRVAKWGRL